MESDKCHNERTYVVVFCSYVFNETAFISIPFHSLFWFSFCICASYVEAEIPFDLFTCSSLRGFSWMYYYSLLFQLHHAHHNYIFTDYVFHHGSQNHSWRLGPDVRPQEGILNMQLIMHPADMWEYLVYVETL
jgi:hypothetical protein